MTAQVIVFAKAPRPGHCKTRLGATLGLEAAAGLYARLLYDYLSDLLSAGWREIEVELAVPPEDMTFFEAAYPDLLVREQQGVDLGQRMYQALQRSLDAGCDRAALTGSDIPFLSTEHVLAALEQLTHSDVVLGPAADGGYYLVGMRAPGADLFRGISWSTSAVLEQTVARARDLGLSLSLLPELADLDDMADYERWRARLLAE